MEKSKAARQDLASPPPHLLTNGEKERRELEKTTWGGRGVYSKVGDKFLGEQYISLHTPHNCYHFLVTLQAKSHFFDLGFTPCKAEHSLRGLEIQEKDEKEDKAIGKLLTKSPEKKCVYQL